MSDEPAIARPARSPWVVALVVSLAAFMEVLDTTITNVSLRHIAGSLAASTDESTWVLTSYLVSNGIVLPLSGWLSNVMGRKNYFMFCIGGFTLASLACGLSISLPMLVVFRLIQGAAGGGLQPTQQSIIIDTFPAEKRGMAFAITGITMIAAPIIGPTLGGWITDSYSWRWIFYINVPVGLFALAMVWRFVEDPPHARATGLKVIDGWSLGLIALGLGAMQLVLDKGQQEDWMESNLIIFMSAVSASALVLAVLRLLKQADPIVDLRLYKNARFALSSILIFLTGFVLYGGSLLMPLMLQTQYGYDATLAGMVLSPGGLVVVIFMPLTARLISRVQARYLIAAGLAMCSFGMWHSTNFSPDSDYLTFVSMRITQVLGLPFLFVPISTLAFSTIAKEKSGKASALYSLARNVGGSVGIAIVATYASRHQQMHQSYLSEHLNPYNPLFENTLQAVTNVTGSVSGAMGYMYQTLLRQSALLAYQDTYFAMTFIMAAASLIALIFLPANRPNAQAAPVVE